MAKRLAEGKRIRTAAGGGGVALATTVDFDAVLGAYVFQDDVTIIGFYVSNVAIINDAHSNADGMIHATIELSRQGVRGQPGIIGRASIHAVWNAILGLTGELWQRQTVMFPDGCGIEVDEGEGVNLLGLAEYVGAGGDLSWWGEFILYYVER